MHIIGGVSALVATFMLKPRHGRFDKNVEAPSMASPTNVMLGTFMLWWGWLGFNTGSTSGISGRKNFSFSALEKILLSSITG